MILEAKTTLENKQNTISKETTATTKTEAVRQEVATEEIDETNKKDSQQVKIDQPIDNTKTKNVLENIQNISDEMKKIIFIVIFISLSLFGSNFSRIENVVFDADTNLSWQDSAYGVDSNVSWVDANTDCSSLSLSEYTDWRLPTVHELRSIIDYSQYDTALNSIFLNEPTYTYQNNYYRAFWTSTYKENDPNNSVRIIDFYKGEDGSVHKLNSPAYTRCVRGDYTFATNDFTRNNEKEITIIINNFLTYIDTNISSYLGFKLEILYLLSVIKQDMNDDLLINDETQNLYKQIQENDKISTSLKERVNKIHEYQKYK